MLINDLIESGLSPKEAKIYIAALELKEASILQLAKKSGLNRTAIYSLLEDMQRKGLLLLYFKGARKVYTAQAPEVVKESLKKRVTTFNSLIPELASLAETSSIKPKIRYNEGLEGIKNAYRGSLQSKEGKLYAFVGVDRLFSESRALEMFWEKEFIPARIRNKIQGLLVVPDNTEGRKFRELSKEAFREVKLVPDSTYNFENEILIYNNTVAILSYSRGEKYALEIESTTIAHTMKMIWQMAWNLGY